MMFSFFFHGTATTEFHTLSLHDALPIWLTMRVFIATVSAGAGHSQAAAALEEAWRAEDRKSTRLNSSHRTISYAVFCLKKKKTRPPPRVPLSLAFSYCIIVMRTSHTASR